MTTSGQRLAAAEVLARAKAKTERVRLLLDADLLDDHTVLSARLDTVEDEAERAVVAQQIVDLEQRIAEAEVEFVLKGIGRARWRKMIADHPPTDEDRAAGAEFDSVEFPVQAIAACLVEPVMTVDEVRELVEEHLDDIRFTRLWTTCLKANLGTGANRPESKRARALLSAPSASPRSEQPSSSESAAASSSAAD